MYIATHLGWVVLSCAVLMFFRKRSIQKNKQTNKKKQRKWNSSISRSAGGTQPPWPGPAGDASGMAERKGQCRAGGLHSGGAFSWAQLSCFPGLGFSVPRYKISHCFSAAGRPRSAQAPARAWLLDIEAGAREGEGSSRTEPISTAPIR